MEIVEILLSAGKMTRNEEIILSQFYYIISANARQTGTKSFLLVI